MRGTYDIWLVTLSVLVAIFVSYTALNLVSRVSLSRGLVVKAWLVGGAHIGWARLTASAVIMGCGVARMHYSGMFAMQIVPMVTYEPTLFALSIGIAIAASFAALWLAFNLRHGRTTTMVVRRLCAAVAMGLAISGMHYTGMAASRFAPGSYCIGIVPAGGVNSSGWLAVIAAVSTVGLLAITLITMVYDAHLESKVKGHAQQLEQANAQLQHLALHDPLTGLANRSLLEDRLTQTIAHAQRNFRRFALLLIDLDRFKSINDSRGIMRVISY